MSSHPAPWDSDRPLDVDQVRRTLEDQFPELAPVRAEWFGSGWDNEVYRVNGDLLFRFPKRAEIVPTIEPEVRLLSLVAEAVSIAIPRMAWIGRPGPDFPYPFVGYRLIPGVGGDVLPDDLPLEVERRIAGQIGRAFAGLHALPVERARSLGAAEHRWDPRGALPAARDVLPRLAALVPPDLFRDYRALLDGAVEPPPPSAALRLTHGDLGAEHLLFDPATLDLTGIIDFADLGLYDPAIDFVALFQWRGEAFVRMVLDAYAPHVDPSLLDRVRFDAVVHAGIWLVEAMLQRNDGGVRSHRYRFEHVIGPTLRSLVHGGRD